MAWLALIVAGVFEVAWATFLGASRGLTRPGPAVAFLVTLAISMALLSVATRTIPVGTGYAVWVGIGAVGAYVVGVVRGEPTSPAQMAAMVVLVAALVAVKVTAACGTGSDEEAGRPPAPGQVPRAAPSDDRRGQGEIYALISPPEGSPDWSLARLRADGTTEPIPTPPGAEIEAPDVSPDGTQVAYEVAGGGDDGIWVTDLTRPDADPRPLDHPNGAGCPRWFPDGRRLAAVLDDRVIVIDTASGQIEVIGPRRGGLELSCADPIDDAAIAVVAAPPEDAWRPQLSSLAVDGGRLAPIGRAPDDCILNSPATAPGGREVAVVAICDDPSRNGLYRVAAAGGELIRILAENPPGTPSEQARQYWDPAWSPDGRTIAYHLSREGSASVRTVGRTGDDDREIAPARACCATVGPEVAPVGVTPDPSVPSSSSTDR